VFPVAVDQSLGHLGRAGRRERSASRDAEQRHRADTQRIQDQGRFRNPVHDPIQSAGVRAADAGAIRGYETQSELVDCAREAVRGQPGIGQPVAEQNRTRIRFTHHLDRDHTAVGSTQLHPHFVSRDLDPELPSLGKTGSAST